MVLWLVGWERGVWGCVWLDWLGGAVGRLKDGLTWLAGWLAGTLTNAYARMAARREEPRTEVEAGPLEADQLRERAPDQRAKHLACVYICVM